MHENLHLLDPKSRTTLTEIYNEFAKDGDFPLNFCGDVSDKIEEELGFKTHYGAFLLDRPRENYDPVDAKIAPLIMACEHAFSTSPEGHIIDLTATQFNPWLFQPIRNGVIVIPRGTDKFNRYLKRRLPFPYDSTDLKHYFGRSNNG